MQHSPSSSSSPGDSKGVEISMCMHNSYFPCTLFSPLFPAKRFAPFSRFCGKGKKTNVGRNGKQKEICPARKEEKCGCVVGEEKEENLANNIPAGRQDYRRCCSPSFSAHCCGISLFSLLFQKWPKIFPFYFSRPGKVEQWKDEDFFLPRPSLPLFVMTQKLFFSFPYPPHPQSSGGRRKSSALKKGDPEIEKSLEKAKRE